MSKINIAVDNQTLLDDIVSCDIKMQESSYCLTVDIQLKSKRFWNLCEPTNQWGDLRIKVIIGDTTYQFLLEERDTESSGSGLGFSIWGRSEQAVLSTPFSRTVTDTEESEHPWQTGSTTASAIVAYVIANYCDSPPSVSWNVTDFVVYKDSFSASNQSPIGIISALASVIGAELVADIDGSLSVESYSVDEGSPVESYNDFDEITQLNESIDIPSGYNAITVNGYDDSGGGGGGGGGGDGGVNASMSTKRQDSGDIYPGRNHVVRLYNWHNQNKSVIAYFDDGSCIPILTISYSTVHYESITEDVRLTFGRGNTSKPDKNGQTEVLGNEDIPLTTVSKTYETQYTDYNVVADAVGDYEIMFYFEDKASTTNYSFSVVAAEGEDDAEDVGICESIVVEKESPTTVVPGSVVKLRVYGKEQSIQPYSDAARPVTTGKWKVDIKTETVTFTNGTATLKYPISCHIKSTNVVQIDYNVSMTPWRPFSLMAKFAPGTSTLKKASFVDNPKYYAIPATVEYYTDYKVYLVTVPLSWISTIFHVWFEIGDCETKAIDLTVESVTAESVTRDITINIKDCATEVELESVTVTIDGSWKGTTDANGNLNLSGIAVGDHTIKLTKTGYLDSDLDDLANDTFTVS
ncbi:MAG: hypothetical protein B6244_14785 [Candidatus Cloacimonetes bacterium 4572_55]|nr:MAG: hypothetical protein B6244_14785 [Candidatus Cloacimonetes bacterium 4572_55]